MFKVVEKALGEVVRSGCAPTLSEAETQSLFQTESLYRENGPVSTVQHEICSADRRRSG